jgi:plasmid stabilization system protein ParE
LASESAVRFAPEAQAELESAARWYAERSDRAAKTFLDAIEHTLEFIQQFPDGWPSTAAGVARRIIVPRTPY